MAEIHEGERVFTELLYARVVRAPIVHHRRVEGRLVELVLDEQPEARRQGAVDRLQAVRGSARARSGSGSVPGSCRRRRVNWKPTSQSRASRSHVAPLARHREARKPRPAGADAPHEERRRHRRAANQFLDIDTPAARELTAESRSPPRATPRGYGCGLRCAGDQPAITLSNRRVASCGRDAAGHVSRLRPGRRAAVHARRAAVGER